MDYAHNLQGFPIYGTSPGAGKAAPRLYDDVFNHQVIDSVGKIITIEARTGNPSLLDGTAIPHPSVAALIQVMVADGITAHM